MGILQFFLIVLIIGFVVFLVQRYAPIPEEFKTIILWAGIIVCVLILLNALGIFGHDWMIPKIR
jgi:hypothetical protein